MLYNSGVILRDGPCFTNSNVYHTLFGLHLLELFASYIASGVLMSNKLEHEFSIAPLMVFVGIAILNSLIFLPIRGNDSCNLIGRDLNYSTFIRRNPHMRHFNIISILWHSVTYITLSLFFCERILHSDHLTPDLWVIVLLQGIYAIITCIGFAFLTYKINHSRDTFPETNTLPNPDPERTVELEVVPTYTVEELLYQNMRNENIHKNENRTYSIRTI